MAEFDGKIAMITGGSRGIGLACARHLNAEGAAVVVLGQDQARLDGLAERFARPERVVTCAADLRSPEGSATALARAHEAFGAPDIIVTAAGLRPSGPMPLAGANVEEFDALMNDNIRSTLLPIHAVVPGMIEKGEGRIVAISGVFGLRGNAAAPATASAKWAIEGLVRSLALELGPSGITVNAVCPGHVAGERFRNRVASAAGKRGLPEDEVTADMAARIPLRRITTEEDVARAVAFLASPLNRAITGQDIIVDGGWSVELA